MSDLYGIESHCTHQLPGAVYLRHNAYRFSPDASRQFNIFTVEFVFKAVSCFTNICVAYSILSVAETRERAPCFFDSSSYPIIWQGLALSLESFNFHAVFLTELLAH